MQASNSIAEFMSIGSLTTKVNSSFVSKEKYLWLARDELRWSQSLDDRQNFSKLTITSIINIKTQEKPNQYLLVLATSEKTYKFSFKSLQIREKWHNGISQLTFSETENKSIRSAPRKSTILGENNKKPESFNNKEVLNDLLNVLKQYSEFYDKNDLKEDDLSTIPKCLESIIFALNAKKWEITQENSKKTEENDPKRLTNKISMLRKRIKMLEIEKDSNSDIENIQFLIEKEKQQNSYLATKIEEATIEKNKSLQESSRIRLELEKIKLLKNCLEKEEKNFKNPFEALLEILKKGFICYVATLASDSTDLESIVLTPRRGYEDGVYKKRLLRLSADLSNISWKAVGLFTKKTFCVDIFDISAIVEGTEDCERFEPFSSHKYITLVTKGLTIMICVENYYHMYLDGIKDLYMKTNGLPVNDYEVSSSQIFKLASEQLQNQIILFTRMHNRYKNSLIDSLCNINFGSEDYQNFFSNEVKHLKTLNENWPMGIMTEDPENYLRTEKKTLTDRVSALNSFLESKTQD